MKVKLTKIALRISLIYAAVGIVWILLSGLALFNLPLDQTALHKLEIIKGLAFVAVTAVLLYILLHRRLGQWINEALERKRVEEALQNNERFLRLVMDLVPHFIFVKDRESRHLLVNRACAQAANRTPEQMVGFSDRDLSSNRAQAEAFMKDDQEVIANGRPKFVEERLTDANGQMRVLQTTKIPFPSSAISLSVAGSGEPAILGVAVDITERKKAEDALRESHAQLMEALQIARLAYWEYDVTNNRLIFNDQFYNILRTTAKREGGYTMSPDEYAKRFVHPDDRVMVRESQKSKITTNPNLIQQFDHRIIYGDGEVGYFSVRVRVEKDSQGRTVRVHGANMDITERKQAELQVAESRNYLSKVINSITDPIFVKDRQHRWVLLNDAFCNFMGRPRSELIGKSDCDFFVKHEADVFWSKDEAVFSSGMENTNEEKFTDGKGTVRTILTKKVLYTDDKGEQFILGIIRDITERKQMEEVLDRERSLLRTLIDNLPDPVYAKDTAGRKTLANRADVKACHCQAEAEIIGKTDFDLFHKDIAEKFWADDQMVLRGQPVINREEYLLDDNGQKRWLLTSKLPLRDQNGKVVGLVGLGRDITERRQAEETYATQQKLLDNLITAIPDLVYFKDQESRFIRINEAYAKRAGLADVKAALGKTDFDIFGEQHAREAYEDERRILATGQPIINKEEREGWPEGRVTWVISTKMPLFDGRGKIIGTMGISRDITERKQAEEELRQLNRSLQTLSKCNEALVRTTDETSLLSKICQIITEIGGYKLAWVGYVEQDKAKSVRPVAWAGAEASYVKNLEVTWSDSEQGRGPAGSAIRTGQPCIFSRLAEHPEFAPWREEAMRHGLGSSIGLPLKAEDKTFGVLTVYSRRSDAFNAAETALLKELADDLAFGISTLRNRSERNQLEEQLRQSQKMEAIGQLAGGVAHDFNNMLTIIQGNASLLLNPQLDPKERPGCSRQIVQAAERAASLTRQLLIFSRKQALQPANVDLNEVVNNMTKMLRRILGEDIALQTHYASQPVFIHADIGMIEQVLMNLLVNARDAMPGGGQLSISTGRQDVDEAQVDKNPDALAGPHICLTVSDTGCGIPKENMARIFDPFFTTKEAGKGTGLGLATVYSIVQQHRGWITVASEVNKGSTFKIYFPAVKGERAAKTPAPQKLLQGSGTILVVEDELAVRTLVSHLLQRCGYTVLQAESGAAALKIWQEHHGKIQLLLTDIIMPDGVNGYELARQLKAAKPKLKVVYTSGYSGDVVGKGLELAEGVNFLQKPYVPQKLLQILHDNFDGKENGSPHEHRSPATKNEQDFS